MDVNECSFSQSFKTFEWKERPLPPHFYQEEIPCSVSIPDMEGLFLDLLTYKVKNLLFSNVPEKRIDLSKLFPAIVKKLNQTSSLQSLVISQPISIASSQLGTKKLTEGPNANTDEIMYSVELDDDSNFSFTRSIQTQPDESYPNTNGFNSDDELSRFNHMNVVEAPEKQGTIIDLTCQSSLSDSENDSTTTVEGVESGNQIIGKKFEDDSKKDIVHAPFSATSNSDGDSPNQNESTIIDNAKLLVFLSNSSSSLLASHDITECSNDVEEHQSIVVMDEKVSNSCTIAKKDDSLTEHVESFDITSFLAQKGPVGIRNPSTKCFQIACLRLMQTLLPLIDDICSVFRKNFSKHNTDLGIIPDGTSNINEKSIVVNKLPMTTIFVEFGNRLTQADKKRTSVDYPVVPYSFTAKALSKVIPPNICSPHGQEDAYLFLGEILSTLRTEISSISNIDIARHLTLKTIQKRTCLCCKSSNQKFLTSQFISYPLERNQLD